jgi:hypothetical protein
MTKFLILLYYSTNVALSMTTIIFSYFSFEEDYFLHCFTVKIFLHKSLFKFITKCYVITKNFTTCNKVFYKQLYTKRLLENYIYQQPETYLCDRLILHHN